MKLLQDGVIAMLAAIGLATVLWLIVGLFLHPPRQVLTRVTAVVPTAGAGGNLEQAVRELARLRREEGVFGTILLVDCGLDDEGQELARLLSGETEGTDLCRREELADYFQ